MSAVPFKANAAGRHHIPRQRHRVTNWPDYDAALRQRGSLTVWFSEEAVAAWRAEPRTTRGGRPYYSALAIATGRTLRAVFRLALRQTEGLIGSIIRLRTVAACRRGLSVKRTLSGHPRNVRKPRTADGKSDNMDSGRVNGHFALAHVGYARVSTLDQDTALQLDAPAAAGRSKGFEERVSGARADRAGLRQALDYVREGDALIVWKLDWLGRSLQHLIETVAMLEKRRVGFRSVTEAIDTTTPGGRLVFHLFGALGQFEKDLIQERTRRPRGGGGVGTKGWAPARHQRGEAWTRSCAHQ